MKLTRLSIKNVNGITASVDLSGKDIFLGPNGCGKSTRLKAVRIARLGKDPDPRVGAQPMGLRKLASGEVMEIALTAREADRTFSVSRTYREKDGTGSQKIRIDPPKGEKTATAMEKRIKEELGEFELMFNASVFDGLSGNGKRDFIFQLCQGASGLSAEEIIGKIVPPEPLTDPADVSFFDSWKQKIAREWRADLSFLDNFNGSLAMVKAAISEMRGKEIGAAEAERRLTEIKNANPEIGKLNLAEIDREIAEKDGKERALASEVSTTRERLRALNELDAEIDRLTGEIKGLPEFSAEDGKALEKAEADYREGRDHLASLRAKADLLGKSEFTPEDDRRLPEIEKEIAGVRDLIAVQERAIAESSSRLFTPEDREKLSKIEKKLQEAREERAIISARITMVGSCPVRINDCEHLKKAKDLREEVRKQLVITTARIDAMLSEADRLSGKRGESDEIAASISNFRADIATLSRKIEDLEREKRDLSGKKEQAGKSQEEAGAIEAEIAGLTGGLDSIVSSGSALRAKKTGSERRSFLETQLQAAQKRMSGIGNVADVTMLESQRAVLAGQISDLKSSRKAKAEAKLAWEQAEKAALDQKRIAAQLSILRSLERLLGPRGIQGEIVRTIMGPLSEKVQSLMVDPSLRFDFRMQDEKGKEIFEIGFSRDGQFISVPSGGESILFRAAFLTALVMQANPRNKTMLLELAECDRMNAEKLLSRLGDYVDKGLLDNVLVAFCYEITVPEGWTAHVLRAIEAAAEPSPIPEVPAPVEAAVA